MLSERIRELRKASGMTQVALAKELGVTKQCVSNWENGNIQPSVDLLVRLALRFGVSTDHLLGLEETSGLRTAGLTPQQRAHIQAVIDDITGAVPGAD